MKSRELLMLQDVWRKAYGKPDGLEITFKSKAGAIRARMQLYNAVNKIKRGTEAADVALAQAAEEIEIVWVNEVTIRLQKRSESDMMQGIMAVLDKPAEEYVDPEMKESADRLMEELGRLGLVSPPVEVPTPAPAPTPPAHIPGISDEAQKLMQFPEGYTVERKKNPFYDR